MHTPGIKQDLIQELKVLHKQKPFLATDDFEQINWASLKTESEQNLCKLKSASKVNEILLFALLTITGVMALLRVFDFGYQPDLNKGALLIFLAATNAVVALRQRIKIARLEKQFLLINFLSKVDANQND